MKQPKRESGGIAFTTPIVDQYGKQMADEIGRQAGIDEAMLTLTDVCVHSLLYNFQDEPTLSGEDKFKRGMLAVDLRACTKERLTAEETALVKKLLGKLYNPIVVVQAYRLLDPAVA